MELCAQVNCLLGDNGTGKTNVFDAVHYLGNAKGYFNPIDSQNIRHGKTAFLVEGTFAVEDTAGEVELDRVACAVAKGQKKLLKRNGKAYAKLADHVGRYPVVMIAPSDSVLVLDGSEVRRKWMDGDQPIRPSLPRSADPVPPPRAAAQHPLALLRGKPDVGRGPVGAMG